MPVACLNAGATRHKVCAKAVIAPCCNDGGHAAAKPRDYGNAFLHQQVSVAAAYAATKQMADVSSGQNGGALDNILRRQWDCSGRSNDVTVGEEQDTLGCRFEQGG